MNSSPPIYVPVKQIIALFGYSRATVHRKLSRGLFQGKKDGRITLVLLSSVIAHVNSLPNRHRA